MRKNSRKPARKNKSKTPNTSAVNSVADDSKRKFLKTTRNTLIGAVVLGGTGYYSVRMVQALAEEADLTKIGNGLPSVVQIHDPDCNLCLTLQRQTRQVLGEIEDQPHNYLVADIRTQKGSQLAARYSVPHVTLLLFDKRGSMKQIVRGPTTTDTLRNVLNGHVKGGRS